MKLHISNVNELGLTQKWLMYFWKEKRQMYFFDLPFQKKAESAWDITSFTDFTIELLTASCFEIGPMPTLTKLWNPTIVGSGAPDSTQWSHPSRFCHWRPWFSNNGYPPFIGTTQNLNLFPWKDFYSLPTQAQKNHLLQLGIHQPC